MNCSTINVQVILDSIEDKCLNLLFEINNHAQDIGIKNTFIVPVVPKANPILIPNFILEIKNGESNKTLHLTWDRINTDGTKIDKIQFLFVSQEGNIISNTIEIN